MTRYPTLQHIEVIEKVKNKTKGGGTAIYVKDGFLRQTDTRRSWRKLGDSCSIYRESKFSKHCNIQTTINRIWGIRKNSEKNKKKLLSEMEIKEPTVIITGDFNFPFIAWKRGAVNAYD